MLLVALVGVYKNLAILTENTCVGVSECLQPEAVIRKCLAQVFSWECCEISMNTFIYGAPLVAASLQLY